MSKDAQDKIELIKAVGQMLVSLIIVGGGLVFMFIKPQDSGIVGGFVGTVIAYYFLSANQARTINKTVKELTGIGDTSTALQVARAQAIVKGNSK